MPIPGLLGLEPNLGLLSSANRLRDDFMRYQPVQGLLGGNQYLPINPSVGDIARLGIEAAPFVGDAKAIEDANQMMNQGRYGMGLLNYASTIPAIGDLATAAKVSLPAITGLLGTAGLMMRKGGNIPVTPFSKQAGIIGYHGSPYSFDAFDMSKIGSGEGAQAYGHGLYFAENPEVAKSYASVGETVGGTKTEEALLKRLDTAQDSGRYTEASVIEDLLIHRSPAQARSRFTVKNGYTPEFVSEANKIIDSLSPRFKDPALYKVDIPDQYVNNFLDWDKPLYEQTKQVRDSLYNVMEKMRPDLAKYHRAAESLDEAGRAALRKRMGINIFDAEAGAGAIYEGLGSPEKASKLLNQAGVKGIRYLDQGSREIGKGTSNFVVFDDKIVKMLSKE